MHLRVINVPACPLWDSFDSDSLDTVITISEAQYVKGDK